LRLEHYASGRLLCLHGGFTAAPIVLAYAIEYHLKGALAEFEDDLTDDEKRLVRSDHKLVELYTACLNRGLLRSTFVSSDFLLFARHHFERRYPSTEDAILRDRRYWQFGRSMLHTYDDCIVQLDRGLAEMYGTDKYLLGGRALSGSLSVSRSLVKALFHDNVHALEDLPRYIAAAREFRMFPPDEEPDSRPEVWYSSTDALPSPSMSLEEARELLEWNLAAFFRYPAQGEPDPDPARLLAKFQVAQFSLPHAVADYKWAYEQAVRAFGRGGVDLVREEGDFARGDKGRVVLTVFERKAKKWFRPVVLDHGAIVPIRPNPHTKAALEAWIAETLAMFRRERNGLRKPRKARAPGAPAGGDGGDGFST
jgi:hypothetical protein